MAQLIIPFLGCEGTSDQHFLLPLLRRVFAQAAAENGVDLFDFFLADGYITLFSGSGRSFTEAVRAAAMAAEAQGDGRAVLCVHADADAADMRRTQQKIEPAFKAVVDAGTLAAPCLIAVVPIHMIEGWLLADSDLLRQKLDTHLPVQALGLQYSPESHHDPKAVLREAHRRAHADRRRRQPALIEIGELYEVIGSEISLQKLAVLSSFRRFMAEVNAAFQHLAR